MQENSNRPRVTHLFTYPIASADIYYNEAYQRTICICDDPKEGFRIWGEIPGQGHITAVNLCEILLEYAMTSNAVGIPSQSFRQIELFGNRIGRLLANYIIENAPIEKAAHLAACGLECIIESMDVDFTVEQDGNELRFILDHCPVGETAKRTGLSYAKLARHGMKGLCQSLIHTINPDLTIDTPVETDVEQVFSVMLPANAY
jgi:hypothetical protein